ncbi:MAG: class I SAM-dependent methyltransferase [Campylobacterota bacterium]|nr:class I SAM-dependent methyltransferase [Campylobacterota bacterium]
MTNLEVKNIVGKTPHMTLKQADTITEMIEKYNISNILELGFAHGVSTSYMAATLGRNGGGTITTIDKEHSAQREPRIDSLLESIGELDRVNIFYEPTSYTWRLMKFLEEDPNPRFDFCYLDGAHSWHVDGFAFFLVDRLLKSGGWIVFDDMNWTYAASPTNKNLDFVKAMPEEEKTTPHISKVFEILVKQHPSYHNFKIKNGWGYAQKK